MQNEVYSPSVDLTTPVASIVSANTVAGNPVQSGDACVIGDIIGIATTSAGPLPGQTQYVASVTPNGFIAVRTKGAFTVPVTPAAAVPFGAKVYIDPATGIISDNAAKTFFGWSINPTPANANVTTGIVVKLKM